MAEFDAKTPWGGMRFGLIYGLAGEYGTGKSLFAMQIAAAGKRAFYIDTENAFQPNALERIASASSVGVTTSRWRRCTTCGS